MRQNRDLVFDHEIGYEGGYSNHPRDRGGPTRYGVTLADLRIWRRDDGLTADDVKVLGLGEAKEIFFHRYWDLVKGDELPSGLDYAVVDFAYNSGVSRSVKQLQQLLGVNVDGIMGMMTVNACSTADLPVLIGKFQDRRQAFLRTCTEWPVFGRGWTNRVREVRATSLALANAGLGDPPASVALRTPEPVSPARDARVAVSPLKSAQQGSALGLFGTTATDAAQQLAPHIDMLPTIKIIFVALTMIGIACALWLTVKNMEKPA